MNIPNTSQIDPHSIPFNTPLPGSLKELPRWATYQGNKLIKKSNVKIQFEEWQIEEIAKCVNDVTYFVENFVYIISPDKGKHLIELYDIQYDYLRHLDDNRFSIVMASRQVGKSTCCAIYVLWYILFKSQQKAVIIANKEKIAKDIFQKVRIAYEQLPIWLQIGVKEWAKTSCVLENGSSCSCEATTEDGMRGITGSLIILDEYAFIKKNIADEFYTSMYPVITSSKSSKLVIVSTPKGLNHFHHMWKAAINKISTFAHFLMLWSQIPGRDEEWKEETIKNIGERRWRQEFSCEFLGSSKTLIQPESLEAFTSLDPIETKYDGYFKIYKKPIKNHQYVVGGDIAKGTGGDYSTAQVLDITTFPVKQVAVYRNNTIGTRAFANLIVDICEMYNDSYLMLENNDIGHGVVDLVWRDIEYENLVNFSYDKKNKAEIGIRSTKKSKSVGCDLLKEMIEENKVEIIDADTIYELSNFTEFREGIFKAADGEHDDLVMALLWVLFVFKTEWVDKDEMLIIEKVEEREEEEPVDPVLGDEAQDKEIMSLNWTAI